MTIWNDVCDELATLEALILEDCTQWPASDYGLDPRCGDLYLGEDFIATRASRDLNLYGGFEDVTDEYIQRVGSLTLYHLEDSRVLAAMQTLEHNHD